MAYHEYHLDDDEGPEVKCSGFSSESQENPWRKLGLLSGRLSRPDYMMDATDIQYFLIGSIQDIFDDYDYIRSSHQHHYIQKLVEGNMITYNHINGQTRQLIKFNKNQLPKEFPLSSLEAIIEKLKEKN
ncbi:MAG: hypothetical protein KC535_04530 [Nanoarchaeota archaeon]|nr:hypothetical protein [Nanoarchaeota archaeon]